MGSCICIGISVFYELFGVLHVSFFDYALSEVDELLAKRHEGVEKLTDIGYYFTVEALFELVNAVVGVALILIERYAHEIVYEIVVLKCPVYHGPLHEVIRIGSAVVVG